MGYCVSVCVAGRAGGCPSKVLGSQGMLGNGLPLSARARPHPPIARDQQCHLFLEYFSAFSW